MKLHRIQTFNLNSLYGAQGIDLDAALAGASLFLIDGPTGSGKSTLMDAVSLALFGTTPRLTAERGDQSADPRAIMSRGTGECSASVVFSKLEPQGRRTYRAVWSCQRARKSPEGAWQDPVRSLERLEPGGDPTPLVSSKTKKEYEPVFAEVLERFGVQDFNRSMLLAQGQFDAFLSARPDARAEILERLTDTAIYQTLGERAARIYRGHSGRLQGLRALAAAGGGLAAAELEQLENEHAANEDELARHTGAFELASACLRWFDEATELDADLAQAVADHAELLRASEAASAQLDRLAAHERCEEQKAFQLLDGYKATRAQCAELHEQLDGLGRALPGLEQAALEAERVAATAAERERIAAAELELLRPVAAAVDQAGAELAAAGRLADEILAQQRDSDERVQQAEQELRAAAEPLAALRAGIARAEAELAAHEADVRLASGWGALRSRLDQLVASEQALDREAAALEAAAARLAQDLVSLAADRRAYEVEAAQRLEPLRRAVTGAEQARRALVPDDELEAARRKAAAALEHEKRAAAELQAAVAPMTAANRIAGHLLELEARIQLVLTERASLRERSSTLQARVLQAGEVESRETAALDRIKLVADLMGHRRALADGQPCPLCGSTEHPWSSDPERAAADAVIGQSVQAATQALLEARQAAEQARRAAHEAVGQERELGAKLELLQEQLRLATREREELDRAAATALVAAGLPRGSSSAALDEALGRSAERLADAEAAVAALDDAARTLDEAERVERAAASALRETEAILRDRETALQERRTQLEASRTSHAAERAALDAERQQCRALLEPHGLTLAPADPACWRQRGDERCQQHEARVKALESLRAAGANAATDHKGKEVLLAEREAKRAEITAAVGERQAAREEKHGRAERAREALARAWRAAVAADGRDRSEPDPRADAPAAAFVEAQQSWLGRARSVAAQAAAEQQRISDELKTTRTRRTTLLEQHAKLEAARDFARCELDRALMALSLDGEAALQALRLEDTELAAIREQRKALEDGTLAAATRMRERREKVEAHAQCRPQALTPTPNRAALVAEQTSAATLRDQAARAHELTRDRLRDHHRATEERAQRLGVLRQAEEQARVWHTLHNLIGVSEGGRFQQFAQALNLGQLLERANVHLARLSNRYELVARFDGNLPTLEFDLADLWQAGERVAPRALSGGERFLVSLALALGLSDFRKVRMPIETLLLDEGFGTLDPETLSVALGALSQLQADGRQVGIISHVVGLRERIEARFEVRPLGAGRSRVVAPLGSTSAAPLHSTVGPTPVRG